MNNRREFLKKTTLISAGLLANNILFNNNANSKELEKILSQENLFQNPPVFDVSNVMMITNGTREFVAGTSSGVISLGGGFPAPTIKVKQGDLLNVSFHNMLSENVNIHWHGIYVPDTMDGHPSNFLKPNQAFTYEYQIIQRAGTYFYHSHTHMTTARQVYNGMYGFLIIEDDDEKALNLPSGEFEMLIAIQDIRIGTNNKLIYSPNALDKMEGWLGNRVLVNGISNTVKKVSKDSYRLRIVNASNARVYKLAFDDNRTFSIIGTDGGLLEKNIEVNSIKLAPAERLDIIVNFKSDNFGTSAKLISEIYTPPVGHMGKPTYPQGIALDIIKFDVTESSKSTFTMPLKFGNIDKISQSLATKTRKFDIRMDMMSMKHQINGKLYDINRIDETINFGDIEVWEFNNLDTDMMHPMHIHGLQFQIISRSLTSIPDWEKGWKDTFLINGGETVKVIAKFNGYKGKYLAHCHNLEHEDDGMMLNYLVSGSTDITEENPNDIIIYPNPTSERIFIKNVQNNEIRNIRIFNNNGNVISNFKINVHDNGIAIDLVGFSRGNYFLTLKDKLIKFIVQ